MKKLASIMFLFMLLLTSVTGCSAALPETDTNPLIIVMQIANPVMTVNGTEKEIDPGRGTSPIIQNDRTFLPVRAVVEAMGGSVAWDGETQTVVMAMENDVLLLSIGSQTAYFNETAQTLDATPVIVGERTMFPIRFIAECFGFEVEWEESTASVTIRKSIEGGAGENPGTVPEGQPDEGGESVLVVYFSRSGTTKQLAETVHAAAGGELVRIVPVQPYPENYDECLKQVQEEQQTGFRPEITVDLTDISQYDTILLGYPIWYGSLPAPVVTFLASYDFSGKTIMPFCTSGGSGIGGSLPDIRALCPNSTVTDGFRGSSATDSDTVNEWLRGNGFQNLNSK